MAVVHKQYTREPTAEGAEPTRDGYSVAVNDLLVQVAIRISDARPEKNHTKDQAEKALAEATEAILALYD